MAASIQLGRFTRLKLLKSFVTVDPETGHVVQHEVRRDPISGTTLATQYIINAPQEGTPLHGKAY